VVVATDSRWPNVRYEVCDISLASSEVWIEEGGRYASVLEDANVAAEWRLSVGPSDTDAEGSRPWLYCIPSTASAAGALNWKSFGVGVGAPDASWGSGSRREPPPATDRFKDGTANCPRRCCW
jgi:hypothetical protein